MRLRYAAALAALAFLPPVATSAQTAPAPFVFTAAAPTYQFSAWDPAAPAGTYPPNMVFHSFNVSAPDA